MPDYDDQPQGPTTGPRKWLEPFAKRFCFMHGQEELLLRFSPLWINQEEFKVPRGKSKMHDKMKKYQRTPWDLDPRLRCNHADCGTSLWRQVDVPLDYVEQEGKSLYQIRWRLVWTPFSEIEDLDRAQALLENQRIKQNLRTSPRAGEIVEKRLQKLGEVAKVVQLEGILEA
ncbi:hypothetical protein EYZ11_006941 [Aspergillus tanneri]|uniref:Uncharacterized protein n=1 Tax=Aspergillus tanneri TaxID=1220188 RepID=A0A4S3JGP0_9EURO|nr:hypothetical protein EYZ11_006941 [Aspergillus tanneri]